jgi:hypothetical protein
MKRTTSGLCLAAAFAFAATLGAQTPASTSQHSSDEVTVSGCLARSASGGFVLNNAKIETDSSKAATGTTGTTGTTATTSGSSGTTAGSMSASAGSTYALEGSSADLEKHVGHKIEVTGKEGAAATTTTGAAGTTGTTGTTGTAAASSSPVHRVDVQSVKMISASCS